jgi:hypothetical protein
MNGEPLDPTARNRLWQSPELEARLRDSRVVLGGVGGLGWAIGGALVGLGVRRLEVFDFDVLDITNLNRLWGCTREDVGVLKTELFRRKALGVDPTLELTTHTAKIPCESFEAALDRADVLFGGFDGAEPRLAALLLARQRGLPYVDAGVGFLKAETGRMQGFGQVYVAVGDNPACLVCAGMRLASPGYNRPVLPPEPSSGVLNGIIANLAVSSWLGLLSGATVPPLLRFTWDAMSLQSQDTITRRPDCPICGPRVAPGTDGDAESNVPS